MGKPSKQQVAVKFTGGYVLQHFVDSKCVGQEFIATDDVTWEDGDGKAIGSVRHEYQPFTMQQPEDAVNMKLIGGMLSSIVSNIAAAHGLSSINYTDPDIDERLAELKRKLDTVKEKVRG